jgi:hypothetical protein
MGHHARDTIPALRGVGYEFTDSIRRALYWSLPNDPVEPGNLGQGPGRPPGQGIARRTLHRLLVRTLRLHPPPRVRPGEGQGPDSGLLLPRPMGPASPALRTRLFANFTINPFQDQVSDLSIVFVLHEHVAVASDTPVRQVEHLSFAAGSIHTFNESVTAVERPLPEEVR